MGVVRHGMSKSPEHRAWQQMLQRCRNPKHRAYPSYGGRGISVCDRWLTFENFFEDVGQRPSAAHSIDRINNDGNYEPNNVRWASGAQQQRNRRTSRLTADEVARIRGMLGRQSQASIARQFEVSHSTISMISRGRMWREEAVR